MPNLFVGDKIVLDGRNLTIVNKWSQGRWFTYTFNDGTSSNFDPTELIEAGRLKILEPEIKGNVAEFIKKQIEPPVKKDIDEKSPWTFRKL